MGGWGEGAGGLEREHHVAMETASDAAEHTDGFSPSNPTLSRSLPPSLSPTIQRGVSSLKCTRKTLPCAVFKIRYRRAFFSIRMQPKPQKKTLQDY